MGDTATLGNQTGGWTMPWLETAPMEQRTRFIDDWQRGLYTMTELCARYNVSRKTGIQVARPLRRWRPPGPGRPEPGAASMSPPDS